MAVQYTSLHVPLKVPTHNNDRLFDALNMTAKLNTDNFLALSLTATEQSDTEHRRASENMKRTDKQDSKCVNYCFITAC